MATKKKAPAYGPDKQPVDEDIDESPGSVIGFVEYANHFSGAIEGQNPNGATEIVDKSTTIGFNTPIDGFEV